MIKWSCQVPNISVIGRKLNICLCKIKNTLNGWIKGWFLRYSALVFCSHKNGHKLVSVYTWLARSIDRAMPGQCVFIYLVGHWSFHALYNGITHSYHQNSYSRANRRHCQSHCREHWFKITERHSTGSNWTWDNIDSSVAWPQTGDWLFSKSRERTLSHSCASRRRYVLNQARGGDVGLPGQLSLCE